MRTRLGLAAVASAVAVLAAACGTAGGELNGAASSPREAGTASGMPTATAAPSDPTSPDAPPAPEPTTAERTEDAPPPAAVAALDFTAPDVGGGEVRGASYAGRDVALWMWAPW